MQARAIPKYIVTGVATVVLGAIGSGVWERLLSPALSLCAEYISSGIASVSSSYSDSLYRRAATFVNVDGSEAVIGLMALTLSYLLLVQALALITRRGFSEQLGRILSVPGGRLSVVINGALFFTVVFIVVTNEVVRTIQVNSIRQMEILRPYIGEHEYHSLRSTLLQVGGKRDFEVFRQKLVEFSVKHSISTDGIDNL